MKDNNVTKLLKAARKLIKAGWTKGWYAKNKAGEQVNSSDVRACKFCALGAIGRASIDLELDAQTKHEAIMSLYRNIPDTQARSIPEFNDKTNKKGILDLFGRAIKASRGK